MDKIISIYNFILHSNLLNFAIFAILIYFICKKSQAGKFIENMCDIAIHKIEDSINQLKSAEKNKKSALKSVKNTPEEIDNINNTAKDKAKILSKQIVDDTKLKILNIQNNAQKIIDSEEKAIKSMLITNIGIKSVESAKKYIINQIIHNPDIHYKFIDESIEELNKAVLNDIS